MSQPFHKFQSFTASEANGAVNLGADVLNIMLSNTPPNPGWATYANAASSELPNANGYHTGGFQAPQASSAQVNGLYTLKLNPATLIASNPIGPFRYAILYDTVGTKPLIGFWDYGGELTLGDTDKFVVQWDANLGALQQQ